MVSWNFPAEWDYAVPMQHILNGRDGYFASARQMNTNGSGEYHACWIPWNMFNTRWSDQIMAPPKANFFRGSLVTVIWGSNGQSELVNGRDILLTFSKLSEKPHRDEKQLVYNKAIWVATLDFEPNERYDSGEDRYGQFKGWITGWSEYEEPVRDPTGNFTNDELALADCVMSDIANSRRVLIEEATESVNNIWFDDSELLNSIEYVNERKLSQHKDATKVDLVQHRYGACHITLGDGRVLDNISQTTVELALQEVRFNKIANMRENLIENAYLKLLHNER